MHKKRCFGNSDNKLVWIPPRILVQYPEKRKICKTSGMAWLPLKLSHNDKENKIKQDIT